MLPPMSTKDVAVFLRQRPVFAGVPAREIDALASVAVEEAHRARAYIFMEGDPSRWFYLVKSGHVKIVRHSKTGKDVVLELLGPGEVFGGVAVIEKRPYPAGAQTTEPAVVVKIPAGPMIALAERHPTFIKEMALMIGRRLRAAHDSVKSLAVDPVEARLAAALLRLAEREGQPERGGGGVTLPFHLTRQSLADMTGTTVETAIRIVSRWLRDGLLVDEGGRLVLTDREGLTALAEGETE
jgi:CRP/FNR family transcriptional regulator